MTLRYSLRTFAVVLTLLPLGLAGVMAGHPIATSAVYTLNWVLLCVALVGSLILRNDARQFWIGFAVFGWIYWLADNELMRPPAVGSVGLFAVPDDQSPDRLLTSKLVDYLEEQSGGRWRVGDAVVAQYRNGGYYPGVVDAVREGEYFIRWTDGSNSPPQWTKPAQIQPGTQSARIAADSFVCSVWGLIGGLLAALLFRSREPAKPAPAAATEE